jgi:hypothetical protein
MVVCAGTQHKASEGAEYAQQRAEDTANQAAREGETTWERIKDTLTGASHQASETADDARRRAQACHIKIAQCAFPSSPSLIIYVYYLSHHVCLLACL